MFPYDLQNIQEDPTIDDDIIIIRQQYDDFNDDHDDVD